MNQQVFLLKPSKILDAKRTQIAEATWFASNSDFRLAIGLTRSARKREMTRNRTPKEFAGDAVNTIRCKARTKLGVPCNAKATLTVFVPSTPTRDGLLSLAAGAVSLGGALRLNWSLSRLRRQQAISTKHWARSSQKSVQGRWT